MTTPEDAGRGGRGRAYAWCAAAYAFALAAAIAAGWLARDLAPLLVVAIADVVGTVVVFAFSRALGNSSLYDPYWSVAPIPIALYWLWSPASADGVELRQAVVVTAVCLWGGRLTYNFLSGWRGLDHEDWRYRKLRADTGRAYWLVSLLGIHLFPTALVYLGCLALWPALGGSRPPGWLDVVAVVVTFGAIAVEALADRQLRRFVRSRPPVGRIMDGGLWGWSRHPNYFGEIGFWWGLWLFGWAAAPELWWTVVGPAAITLLFLFISIPMIERRMARRREGWDEHRRRVSMLVPWLPRRG